MNLFSPEQEIVPCILLGKKINIVLSLAYWGINYHGILIAL